MSRWDDGLRVHEEEAEAIDWSLDPLQVPFVRDQHLKLAAGPAEDIYVDWLIRASYRQAAITTQRGLIPQRRRLVLSGFPAGPIEPPRPPLLAVLSIAYVDPDGVLQILAGSPPAFAVQIPVGPTAPRGSAWPLPGESWPATRCQADAVVVTFDAGYTRGGNGLASIPEDITDGRLMWIAERYKQRSLSVHAFNQNPAVIRARDLWLQYKAY